MTSFVPNWFANSTVLNVKSFGAVGNGVNNDTSAIQAAFNQAFGPASAPHGNARGIPNLPVYFPAGEYYTDQPLVVTNAWGGKILGDGALATKINYQGAVVNQPSPVNSGLITPVLWLNGASYFHIDGISFKGPPDPTGHQTACIWFAPDGQVSAGSTNTNCNANLITNCKTETTSRGIHSGSNHAQALSENTFINCEIYSHEYAGFFASAPNTLNFRLLGCSVGACGSDSTGGGIILNNNANFGVIENTAFDHNWVDISFQAACFGLVSACRTESAYFVQSGNPSGGCSVTLLDCTQATTGSNAITGYTVGTTFNVVSGTLSNTVPYGMYVYDAGNTLTNPTQIVGMTNSTTFTLSNSSTIGSVGSPVSFTVRPVFLSSINQCNMAIIGLRSSYDPVLIVDANTTVRLINNCVSGNATDLFKPFAGHLSAYDWDGNPNATFSIIPTAKSAFKGIRTWISDCTQNPATAANWGQTVTGAGSFTAPIWCDGTNWRMG